MISISPFPPINKYHSYAYKSRNIKPVSFSANDVSSLIEQGDKALNENRFQEALRFYQQANQSNPEENTIYRKMAKAYHHLKDYTSAEKNFKIYLEKAPGDTDCWIELGEAQRQNGYYQNALKSFEKAYSLDSSNDLARRSIMETKNNILSIHYPQQAAAEKQQYAAQNLKTALDMTVQYMTPEYMKDLSDVTIGFGETADMGGTSNIAQYENYKKSITVSDSYIYAAPQVIAAYLAHESVHAKDKDAYTSIKEEQDAYQVAAKFWIQNSNGVKDPEMDYAAGLYQQSPSALDNRVEEIYTLRDPSIAQTSPNHPPEKLFHFNPLKKKAASQSLKQYDVIA